MIALLELNTMYNAFQKFNPAILLPLRIKMEKRLMYSELMFVIIILIEIINWIHITF